MASSPYEGFLADVVKDFDSRVQAIQLASEENMKAYESYCGELKRQLEVAMCERDQLLKRLAVEDETKPKREGVEELLKQLTALSVTLQQSTSSHTTYHCKLLTGQLQGLQFTLTLDKASYEYKYEPCKCESASVNSQFNSALYFPDYMLSRFLTNLLNATFSKSLLQ